MPALAPLHKYYHCGPFNKVLPRARSRVDSICRDHDIAYGKLGKKAYFYYNKADDEFVERMSKEPGLRPRLYSAVFQLKKAVAPQLPSSSNSSPMPRPGLRSSNGYRRTPPTPRPTPSSSSLRRRAGAVRQALEAASKRGAKVRRSRGLHLSSVGSLSGGRFRASRRPWRRVRKYRRRSKTLSSGVMMTTDSGLTTTSGVPYGLWIGHTTYPKLNIQQCLMMLFVKRLLMKLNKQIINWNQVATSSNVLKTDDYIRLYYKANQDPTTAISYIEHKVLVTDTFYVIANALNTLFISASTDETVITHIEYEPVVANSSRTTMDLSRAKVLVDIKSSFKIQNQTVAEGGDDDFTAVNNIPLYGKLYEGGGSGTLSNRIRQQEQQFIAGNASTAIMVKNAQAPGIVGSTVTSNITEPPPPGYFNRVKRVSKAHLDPGQIKTSVLTHKRWMSVQNLVKMIYPYLNDAYPYVTFGKFRLFFFEHMIKYSEDTPNIVIRAEVENKVGMQLKIVNNFTTDELCFQRYDTY